LDCVGIKLALEWELSRMRRDDEQVEECELEWIRS
jgi:hypothetical protein